jgi:hypothetical protein
VTNEASRGAENHPSVSVVVPTKERPALLEKCLTALLADAAAREVIVVRDGNDPATRAVIEKLAARDERLREIAGPRDVARLERGQAARDRGARAARCEVVLAVDDDVIAWPGLVAGHARHHATQERIVVLGYMPVVLPPRGAPGRGPARLYAQSYERACRRFEQDSREVLRGLWGGNFSARHVDWLAVQDQPVVGSFHADQAFGLRLRTGGLVGIFDRSLRADHRYRRTFDELVADASSSAIGRSEIQALGIDDWIDDAPRPVTALLLAPLRRAITSDRVWEALRPMLVRLAEGASRRRLESAELLATRLLWRLAFDRTRMALEREPGTWAARSSLQSGQIKSNSS